jgi:hypothetical protein
MIAWITNDDATIAHPEAKNKAQNSASNGCG